MKASNSADGFDNAVEPLNPAANIDDEAAPLIAKPIAPPSAEGSAWKQLPVSVFFIIGNEFCERFSFYGMRSILFLYLRSWLGLEKSAATSIVHAFNFFAYFCTLIGGILSDSYWGKFKTILYLSVVYCIGSITMSVTAFPGVTGTPPHWWGVLVGLLLLGFGTGGIKPCVSSFGGDQFDPSQTRALTLFFTVFYFSINAGSVLSMFITPLLNEEVPCFGQTSCYPLAFGVPAILMLVATLIFVSGFRMYKQVLPGGNVVVKVTKVIYVAVKEKYRTVSTATLGAATATTHWLQYASHLYPDELISDIHALLGILLVFVPVPLFWMCYDQQASSWIDQAANMDGNQNIFGWQFRILPEQMQTFNAVLILILIPVFDKIIYPLARKLGFKFSPLQRMGWGIFLCIVAFYIAAFLQLAVDESVWVAVEGGQRVCVSGCINMLAQVPQILVITSAEILISITGLEFAYAQAPSSMKSVCSAAWLLCVAVGNLLVIAVTEIDPIRRIIQAAGGDLLHIDAWNYMLYGGLLAPALVLYVWIARRYVYLEERRAPIVVVTAEEDRL